MAGSTAQQQQSGRELWTQEDFGIGATKHVPGATEHVPIVEVAFCKWQIVVDTKGDVLATL